MENIDELIAHLQKFKKEGGALADITINASEPKIKEGIFDEKFHNNDYVPSYPHELAFRKDENKYMIDFKFEIKLDCNPDYTHNNKGDLVRVDCGKVVIREEERVNWDK